MSTIKSSSADLTLNADGSGNDIIFQSNASQVGSLTAEGALTATSASFSTADNSDTLTLTSTAANAGQGPNLRLYRNSGSPADSDILGMIDFEGRNDNSQDYIAAQIETLAVDVSDGTEDAYMNLSVMLGGTLRSRIEMDANELVINEAGQDLDFRVESDGAANMFVIDAADNKIGIGLGGVSSVQYGVHINTADQGNLPTLQGDADDLVIENSTPGITLMGATNGGGMLAFGDTADADVGNLFYYHVDNSLEIRTNGTAWLDIRNDGNLVSQVGAGASKTNMTFKNGGVAKGSIVTSDYSNNTTYNTTSDYRLKENIVDMSGAITRLKTLQPRRFNFKANTDLTMDGFIAHEVSDTVPEAITGAKDAEKTILKVVKTAAGIYIDENIEEAAWTQGKIDGNWPSDSTWTATENIIDPQQIDQGRLVPLLVGALQEAVARIETLETRVTALE